MQKNFIYLYFYTLIIHGIMQPYALHGSDIDQKIYRIDNKPAHETDIPNRFDTRLNQFMQRAIENDRRSKNQERQQKIVVEQIKQQALPTGQKSTRFQSSCTISPDSTFHHDHTHYVFISNDPTPQELPANPRFKFLHLALHAKLALKNEPSLHQQTQIIAQAHRTIFQLAGQYDNNLEIAHQAQQICQTSFAEESKQLGAWQYICDHIKQKGSKRASVAYAWTTNQLAQIWTAKKIFHAYKGFQLHDKHYLLDQSQLVDTTIKQALTTALQEERKL